MATSTVEKTKISGTGSILLRRKNKLVIKSGENSNSNHVKAIAVNATSVGYVLSPDLIKVLETVSIDELSDINNHLIYNLKKLVGANVKHSPLFRNFPEGVPEDFQYHMDRVASHFDDNIDFSRDFKLLSCGHIIYLDKFDLSNFGACPVCQQQVDETELFKSKKRDELTEGVKFKILDLGNDEDIFSIFKNLLSAKTSISKQDMEDVSEIFLTHIDVIENHFPEEIFHKEILSFVSSLVLEHMPSFEFLQGKVKTSTDVLRIAVAMSGGDISLATPTKFKKFSRKERRFLLTLLEGCRNLQEDMVRYKNYWIRLGEILHPGEYEKKFPDAYTAFSILREGVKIETFNSKAEALIKDKKIAQLITHLSKRPSEFARKLDFILTNSKSEESTLALNEFGKVAEKIPTPTLLQVMANFKIRANDDKNIRIILPKGNLAKVKIVDDFRPTMPQRFTNAVVNTIHYVLMERFSTLPELGKVYIDPSLSKYVVPSSQRSASKSLHTITRGSQVSMTDENVVRMFLYWLEPDGYRTDIDLSASMYDENWEYKEHISFTNLSSTGCVHSGDIQSAPNGASEFIDIDKNVVLSRGIRYVAMNVYSFTGQPFVEMPECFAGIMGRKSPKSGEIYEAKTVKQKFDLTADSGVAIPLIIDLYENKIIWTDLSLKGGRTIESNSKNMKAICGAISKMSDFKPNLYDLLKLHADSRGEIVDSSEEADVVFDQDNVPFEIDRIMTEFLS